MRTLRFLLLMAASIVALRGQTADQPLTNTDIESMLSAGLPESTIVMNIQKASYFGLLNLDASPAALIALKQKGASEQVLNAVVYAEPFSARWKEAQAVAQQKKVEDQAAPGLPDSPGVYFKASSGWIHLSSFLFWAPFYSARTWMYGSHESSVPLGQGHSEPQIGEAEPSFYIRMSSSGEAWQLVHADFRKDQRQLKLTSSPGFDRTESLAASQLLPVQMTHVAGDIFTLRPNAPLQPGEYALCTGVQGGPGLDLCYSFGIRP